MLCRLLRRILPAALITVSCLFALLAFSPLLAPHALAARQTPATPATTSARFAAANAPDGHVTIIVLDMSGSMARNDPDGLRCSAANAYIDLSGPNQYVGVISLDNNTGARGGPHNFELAQVWAQPAEMATEANRHALIQTIEDKSNNCRPDNETPTYDALNQALSMLTAATARNTQNTPLSGSVILLTDGAPDPDPSAQQSAILQELAPQFQRHGWPVDVIALGSDTGFHAFLNDLSSSTSGAFYDDGHGVVAGQVSALNIAPFFVDIFHKRVGRVLGPTLAPLQLDGGTVSRDFQLSSHVDHLDVIVVKDAPQTSVTLTDPEQVTLPPEVAGTFISTDPHYAIFSIDGPQSGTWTVNVSGSGLVLMDSLIVSSLTVSIVSPAQDLAFLPLGQDFTVSATIEDHGQQVTGDVYSVNGTIAYSGDVPAGQQAFSRGLDLSDSANPGTYAVKVNVPLSALAGTYTITVAVSQISAAVISETTRTIRLDKFPVPCLSPKCANANSVDASAVRWDGVMQAIYGRPIGIITWLSQLPLGGLPAIPSVVVHGEVSPQGSDATVTGTATRVGSKESVPVTLVNDGGGRFHVVFPVVTDGTYTVTFLTSGDFKKSHFDKNVSTGTVRVTLTSPTLLQTVVAWSITLLYLFLLVMIANLFIRPFTPVAEGGWSASGMNAPPGDTFAHVKRRNLLRWYFRRNVLTSEEAFGEPGLKLIFKRGGDIRLRKSGRAGSHWKLAMDDSSTAVYDPTGDGSQNIAFTIDPSAGVNDTIYDGPRRGGKRRSEGDDLGFGGDDEPRRRRGERKQRQGPDADDWI